MIGEQGVAWPIWSLLFGQSVSAFSADTDEAVEKIEELALLFVYVFMVLFSSCLFCCW